MEATPYSDQVTEISQQTDQLHTACPGEAEID